MCGQAKNLPDCGSSTQARGGEDSELSASGAVSDQMLVEDTLAYEWNSVKFKHVNGGNRSCAPQVGHFVEGKAGAPVPWL